MDPTKSQQQQQVEEAIAYNKDNYLNNRTTTTIPKVIDIVDGQDNHDAIAMSAMRHSQAPRDDGVGKPISGPLPAASSRRRRISNQLPSIEQPQFIEALSAPKRWLNFVTIEPLAFIAILALYIEFPSIQDLIYTKICLQVMESNHHHPNLTQSNINNHYNHSIGLKDSPLDYNQSTNRLSHRALEFEIGASNQTSSPSIPSPSPTPNSTEAHFLCDRFDKTAIPANLRQEIVASDSLFWLKYQLIICLLCAISCPYWGGMSDKIGRLIPLNVPIMVAILSNLISLLYGLLISLNLHDSIQIEWLYLGAVLTGLSGGQAVVIVGSFSFISDNTSSESRSRRVTVLESVIYLSHSVGFFLNKFIMSLGLATPERPWSNRHMVAFSLCAALNFICILYSVFKLRHHQFHRFMNNFEREHYETYTGGGSVMIHTASSRSRFGDMMGSNGSMGGINETSGVGGGVANVDRPRELTASTPDDLDGPIVRSDKRWTDWGTILTFKYYKQTYETATKPRETRTLIQLLLLCGFISAMSLACLLSLLYIYVRSDPFNWTTSQYSWWNTITSVTRGIALVGLTLCMKLISGWNIPDPLLASIGFLSKGVGLFMIALAQSSAIINWALIAFVLSEFSMPPIRSLLSKLVVKEEVGKVYSCLAAMQSICFLLGNIVFYLAYTSLELEDFFRLCFLTVASFQFVAIIIMLIIYTNLRSRVMLV